MNELDIEYWRIVNDYDKENEGPAILLLSHHPNHRRCQQTEEKISLGVVNTGDFDKAPHNKYRHESLAP